MDRNENTKAARSSDREERSLTTDAATAFVVGVSGGAGTAVGASAVEKLIGAVTDKLGSNDPPSQIVLPPGVEPPA